MSNIKNITPPTDAVTENPWEKLKTFTDARIGLGRAGISLPTKHLLAFQLAHAKAQDAVHAPLDTTEIAEQLNRVSWTDDAPLLLHSQANNRADYLQRPDQGRLLDDNSAQLLAQHFNQYRNQHHNQHSPQYDLVIAVVDGLSALAIKQNALPFLNTLFLEPLFQSPNGGDIQANNIQINNIQINNEAHELAPICIAPVCIVEQGRVAIGDDICQRLNAKCVLVLIGERPGLSSPDSMGIYLTWGGKVGCTDAYRNCISNVRPAGLNYAEAAQKTRYLLSESRALQLSGVKLKDRSEVKSDDNISQVQHNFLIT